MIACGLLFMGCYVGVVCFKLCVYGLAVVVLGFWLWVVFFSLLFVSFCCWFSLLVAVVGFMFVLRSILGDYVC